MIDVIKTQTYQVFIYEPIRQPLDNAVRVEAGDIPIWVFFIDSKSIGLVQKIL